MNLHSTMFLLKRRRFRQSSHLSYNLHSTMFLLKPVHGLIYLFLVNNLHSTMFLLKPVTIPAEILTAQIYIPQCFY